MSRGLPLNVKLCLDKALDSALLSVETYNKPAVKFKSGGYIVWGCSALITVSFEHESQLKIIQGSYEKIYVGHSPNGYNRYYRSGGFRGLANLTTFDASNCSQIESIEPSAFYHCSKLQSVKVGTMIPPTCGIDAFSELNSYTILTVPKESIEAYKQANEWKNFTNITALN